MTRPSFQFYTKDWRSNSKLRRCSPAARGVWIDILCALHDSDEYGIARYPLRELASEVGASLAHCRELVDKGVLKGADEGVVDAFVYVPRSGRKDGPPVTLLPVQSGPLWYSSRMVKDEYVNTHRGEGTRFGEGKGESPKPSPTRRKGAGPSTASATASAEKENPPASLGPPTDAAKVPDLTAKDLVADGIDAKHARDWLRIRKAKHAPLTETAWTAVKAEAAKAGMTPAQAVKHAAESNWQGFKASWLKPGEAHAGASSGDVFAGAR